jgi:hypothetical protein
MMAGSGSIDIGVKKQPLILNDLGILAGLAETVPLALSLHEVVLQVISPGSWRCFLSS